LPLHLTFCSPKRETERFIVRTQSIVTTKLCNDSLFFRGEHHPRKRRPDVGQKVITRPTQTILVLITDLYEGGNQQQMLRRAAEIVQSGVQMICLLALDDRGRPAFDQNNATKMAQLGVPTFSCTPDLFPDLMAAAIQKQDLGLRAAKNDIVAIRAKE
jgi:hypothetical protein